MGRPTNDELQRDASIMHDWCLFLVCRLVRRGVALDTISVLTNVPMGVLERWLNLGMPFTGETADTIEDFFGKPTQSLVGEGRYYGTEQKSEYREE